MVTELIIFYKEEKMRRFWIFLVLIVFAAYGCQQRVATKPDGQQSGQQQESSQAQKGSDKGSEQKASSVESKDISSKSVEEKEGMFKDILFDFDKYDVKVIYKPVLQAVSSWMTKNSSARLSIEGHCDERGTNEYNLALGDRRAKAVKDSLVSVGVPSAKIDTLSYGEEKPLCKDQNEECWAKNRRAHFVVLEKAGK